MSNSEPSPEFWAQCYENENTGWDRGQVHPALIDWMDGGELSPCQIAVPGCGRGYEVIHLSHQGFDVTAIDYVAAPIQHLKQRLDEQALNAELHQSDLFSLPFESRFDVVYEQTCLCALQPSKRERYAETIYKWLQPGGKLLALFMQTKSGAGPPFPCTPADMKQLFSTDRWQWETEELRRYDHPAGGIFELAAILVRKP